jgi:Fe-S-cluster containining protein
MTVSGLDLRHAIRSLHECNLGHAMTTRSPAGGDDTEGPEIEGDSGNRLKTHDQVLAEQEIARRQAEADMDLPVVQAIKSTSTEALTPVRYEGHDTLCFDCHKGVSCWNACCYDTDILLTPFDLLRLARHFEARPADIVRLFGTPAVHDKANMPVVKLRMVDSPGEARKPCVFLDEVEGCTVYENRPAACRYYPLGLAAIKVKEQEDTSSFYFLVKEAHCKGHDEPKRQTVDTFRAAQGVEDYDAMNAGWMHILMKLTSWRTIGGPWGKEPDERVKRMFWMASTDLDAFRKFVFSSSFLDRYDIPPAMRETLAFDDEALLQLAFDWLRNVIFNEPTIALKDSVLQNAIAKAQRDLGAG